MSESDNANVEALIRQVIEYTQKHPMHKALAIIENYCDTNHSWVDKCDCPILMRLIKGENK
jgi:zona occludens toxin (predicted ATPase)